MALKWLIVVMIVVTQLMAITRAASVGVNYGTKGSNLPSKEDAINLLKRKGIPMVRFYEPEPEALEALRGSDILVSLGTNNQDIPNFASNPQAAVNWFNTNVAPFKEDVKIKWITIGNEVIPGEYSNSVLAAMQNMKKAIESAGLSGSIFVSTPVPMSALGSSYPPSAGAFASEVVDVMTGIVSFLEQTGAPLMVNVYPYFAYVSEPSQISSEYALFTASSPSVVDQGLKYYSLFDAMLDAFLAAVLRVGGNNNITIVVSESGWPSDGNAPYTSIQNAQTYNNNLKKHAQTEGTPRRPNVLLDTFIFALFNENQKAGGEVEENFGNFYPDMTPVYPLW